MNHTQYIVNARQRCDLEMLLVGGFNPLTGFLSKADYEQVLLQSRLSNGQFWPMPITLDVSEEFAQRIVIGQDISLCDMDNSVLAHMTITDKWKPDKILEAQQVYQTQDIKHPGVNYLLNKAGGWYLGGLVQPVKLPAYYDFVELRHTPASLKRYFNEMGYQQIVGFQTRNPIHRAHMELTLRAAKRNRRAYFNSSCRWLNKTRRY